MNAEYWQHVRQGYSNMGNLRVAICSTVRDCGSSLPANIDSIEKLRTRFRESHVVIVENNSVDSTKAILERWEKQSRNVRVDSRDYGPDFLPHWDEGTSIEKYFTAHRVSLMCRYRNIYLDYVSENLDIDYLLAIDLDVHHFDHDGIAHSFGQELAWDCMTSNGRNLVPEHPFRLHFYDTYAFREEGEQSPQTLARIKVNQVKYRALKKGMPIMKIRSGFNGLALYRWSAMKNFRYRCVSNDDPVVATQCEHVAFHEQMIGEGHDAIYLNPSQLVLYGRTGPISRIKHCLYYGWLRFGRFFR